MIFQVYGAGDGEGGYQSREQGATPILRGGGSSQGSFMRGSFMGGWRKGLPKGVERVRLRFGEFDWVPGFGILSGLGGWD